jgi:hypothetical protein
MIRILLPLAVVAALIFGPLVAGETTSVGGITKASTVTGMDYVGPSIACWRAGEYSIAGECKPNGALKGSLVLATLLSSAIAAVIGVIGVAPFIGRLTSVVTTLGGAISMLAMGAFALMLMNAGSDSGETVQWGTYLAGGGGLLTLISGLSGMRGQ